MKVVRTWVNDKEWEKIKEYCRRRGISMYKLLKDSLFRYMKEFPVEEGSEEESREEQVGA